MYPPLFIKVPLPSQKSERLCVCVKVIDFPSFNSFSSRRLLLKCLCQARKVSCHVDVLILFFSVVFPPPPFIEVPFPSHASELSCICARIVDLAPFYGFFLPATSYSSAYVKPGNVWSFIYTTIFLLDLGTVPTVWYLVLYKKILKIPKGIRKSKKNGQNNGQNKKYKRTNNHQ